MYREDTTYATISVITKERCNDSGRDESTEKRLHCQRQYICTPHVTQYPARAMATAEHQSAHARIHA